LDRIFNYGDPEKSEIRKRDLEHNFTQVVDFAIKERSDIFLIGGDIFDRANPTNAARTYFVNQIKRLKDNAIETFLIGGNHDVPKIGNQTLAIQVIQAAGLATVFSESLAFQETILDIKGEAFQIIGKSYNSIDQALNPFQNFKVEKKGTQICLAHASLIGMNVAPDNPNDSFYNPFGVNDIPDSIDYLALGHYHNHFERNLGERKICNPGSIERLTWQDANTEKGFIFAEVANENSRTTFIPLKTRKYENVKLVLDKDTQNIHEAIVSNLSQYTDPERLLRVNVSCSISHEQRRALQISELMNDLQPHFFHLDISFDFNLPDRKKIWMGKVDNPASAFINYIEELIHRSSSEDERKNLNDAKILGLQYLGAQIDNN
jgi:DNA repair exonuclease SbcCD nuclease subunit